MQAIWVTAGTVLVLALPADASAVSITLGTPDPSQGIEALAECALVAPCATKTVVPTHLSDPAAKLIAPADGTVVSWRVKGAPPSFLRLRVVRREGDGSFRGIDTSGIAKVSDGISGTPLKMAIDAGEQVGLDLSSQPSSAGATVLYGASAPGATWSTWDPGLADGSTSAAGVNGAGLEPLFNATVELFRPAIFQVSPLSGSIAGGQPVYITGRHLTRVTAVSFGGEPAQLVEETPEQVLVVAPAHAAGSVDVVLSTAGGPSLASVADDFTYLAPRAPLPPDYTKPRLSSLKLSPRIFLASPSGPSAISSLALGADVRYRVSEPATTKFKVERREGRRFVRLAGELERADAPGPSGFHFSGRLNRRALPPGRYRLVARATDAAGNRSKARRRGFQILAGAQR